MEKKDRMLLFYIQKSTAADMEISPQICSVKQDAR